MRIGAVYAPQYIGPFSPFSISDSRKGQHLNAGTPHHGNGSQNQLMRMQTAESPQTQGTTSHFWQSPHPGT